jgi:formylglycine-generating enzyme required for sulfatase activity
MSKNTKLFAGLLSLALAGMTAQAAVPSLSYEVSGNELIINYTGTLLQSGDAVNWTEVTSASSPYKVTLGSQKLFFCASASDEPVNPLVPGKDVTISLPDGVSLNMIWINSGSFTMGSPENELGRQASEVQHRVTLTKGYWLGKYEVTQAQYKAVTGSDPSSFKGADLPVEQVSWDDAMAFCKKLTEIEKAAGRLSKRYEYTLPTEAQWEYACRAGTTTALNNGRDLSDPMQSPEMNPVGWYRPNSNTQTHPVGEKNPNAWGLYDMHGNVHEWCLDWSGDYPTSSVTDPEGPATGSSRVIRGGNWGLAARFCRSAARGGGEPGNSNRSIGFRVAIVPVK